MELAAARESNHQRIANLLRKSGTDLTQLEHRQATILSRIAGLYGSLDDSSKCELVRRQHESCDNAGPDNGSLEQDVDVEKRLSRVLREAGADFVFKRVPADYYGRSFEERRDLLGAASVEHLCKSIVMVNTQAHESVIDCSDHNNSKYYVIVVQYTARLNAEKVRQFVYSLNNGKIPKKRFNLRLALEEKSNRLTGFEHNAVTSFGMRTNIPVILSDAIVKLNPTFFWLGGGEVDLKLGLKPDDFVKIINPFVVDCIY